MYIRNVDGSLNREGLIEYIVEVNIYYQRYRKRMEINMIEGQKWMVILRMLWLACHNPKIDWKTGKVKMTRCSEECRKQWRLKQEKLGQQKQKEEEVKKETERKQEEQEKRKQKRRKVVEVKRVPEEWEIWEEEEKAARLEEKAKKLVSERFYQRIKVFGKKQLKRMPHTKDLGPCH